MKKNVTFLTELEQKELRTLRNENINDDELQPFIAFLKKNGEKFSFITRGNIGSVHRIAKDFFIKKVAYKEGYEAVTQKLGTFKYYSQFDQLVIDMIPSISPEIDKYREYASKLNMGYLHCQAQSYIWNHLDTALNFYFDYLNFIADPDFDLSIYSIDHLENNLKDNTIAIHNAFDGVFKTICKSVKAQDETTEYNAYNLFIDTVSKSLNEEQKELIKDNFMDNFKFYLDNAKPDLIKNRDNDFRKSVKYIYLKTQPK